MISFKRLSLTFRLIFFIVAPLPILGTILLTAVLQQGSSALEQEMDERGNMVVASLASSSEYGVISGNIRYLERVVDKLMRTDENLSAVDILDKNGRIMVSRKNVRSPASGVAPREFSADISREFLDLDPVDPFALGNESITSPHSSKNAQTNRIVGTVKISLIPINIVKKQTHRNELWIVLFIVCCIGVSILSYFMAQRHLVKPLMNVVRGLKRIGTGKYDTRIEVTEKGEFGELQRTTNELANHLYTYSHEMDQKVRDRTQSLNRSNDEKRKLIQKVTTAVEEERRGIALEIHDHLNASLVAVRLYITKVIKQATEKEASEKTLETIAKAAMSAKDEVENLYALGRGIVKRLRPEIIDTLGLRDALDEIITSYKSLPSNCSYEFDAKGNFENMDSNLAIAIYRIVQESLSNISKYAQAKNVAVFINVDDIRGLIDLSISDDGVGFDVDIASAGIGLVGMRERVQGAGGEIVFDTAPGRGTTIEISMPIIRSLAH